MIYIYIYKTTHSPYWRGRVMAGKVRARSTKTTDPTLAEKVGKKSTYRTLREEVF